MHRYFRIGLDFDDHGQWYLDQPTNENGTELVTGTFWRGERWTSSTALKTKVRQEGHPVSFSHSGASEYIVSKTLMDVLRDALPENSLQGIPVVIEGYDDPYEILNVLDVVDCVDESRSDFSIWAPEDGRPEMVGEYRMNVLKIDAIKTNNHELFRIAGWRIALICSERIRNLLVKNGVTGVRFMPVD